MFEELIELSFFQKWIESSDFAISMTHGALYYRENGKQYTLKPVDGDVYLLSIDNLGDEDAALGKMSQEDRTRIALNIKSLLLTKSIEVDIFRDHRPLAL